MANSHEYSQPPQRQARRRLTKRQKAAYARRRATVLVLAALLLTGVYFSASYMVNRLFGAPEKPPAATSDGQTSPAPAATADLPFEPEKVLDLPALGADLKVAVSPAKNALRQVALVSGTGKSRKMVGKAVTVPDFPLSVSDLPGAKSTLVMAGKLPTEGQPTEVKVGIETALQAMGGEPDYKAWRPDPSQGLVPVDYYSLAAPTPPADPTAVVVDKGLNALWYFENGKLAATYRVATGRFLKGPKPSFQNQAVNYVTPLGRYTISFKAPGMAYYKKNIPAGDPKNPLGTRFMGFSVFAGDSAQVWAIHGTDEPDSIGKWASDGCIRLNNKDVEALYEKVKEGTPLIIVDTVNK